MGNRKSKKVAVIWEHLTHLFPLPCPHCGTEVRSMFRHNPQQWEGCSACVTADVLAATFTASARYMVENTDMPWQEEVGQ